VDIDALFIQNSILSIVLGFLIGLQREMHASYAHRARDFGGMRTFSMIALLGYLSAWATAFSPYLFLVVAALTGLLLIAAYVVNSMAVPEKGTTSEFSALVTFVIGGMLHFTLPIVAVFTTILVLSLLNVKEKMQEYKKSLTREDISAAIVFMVMTFVILPVLPDRAVDPMGLVNLYRIWIMVVLVAGISFFGYIAIRFFGSAQGIGIAGLFGGLVSSTAVAMSMARQVRDNAPLARSLAVGIALASSMMLVRAGIEMWVINPSLVRPFVIPILVGSLTGFAYIAMIYFTSQREKITHAMAFKNPFDLKEALFMGLVFGLVLALVKLADLHVGDMGVYAVAFVSGVADVDAIILSLSSLAKSTLNADTARNAVVIAIVSNTLAKGGLVLFLGNAALFRWVSTYYLVSVGSFTAAALLLQ